MLKKHFINKIYLTEGLIISFSLIWFFVTRNGDQQVNFNIIINLTFLALLVSVFVFRSTSRRHMFFAFTFLIFSVIADIFGLSSIVSLTSSLTLSLFILGVLNMIAFKNINYNG